MSENMGFGQNVTQNKVNFKQITMTLIFSQICNAIILFCLSPSFHNTIKTFSTSIGCFAGC